MDYVKLYPLLSKELKFLTVENGLSESQFKVLLNRGLEENPDLRHEIIRSFDDDEFSWMDILNHAEIGEVYEAEAEEDARNFAAAMFLEPAIA